jgi:alkyl hydroperoxide reductase subunit AhpF
MAIENPQITSSIVEAGEYPDLIDRYNISGVPQTVVNDRNTILGSLPEASFVAQALEGFTGSR